MSSNRHVAVWIDHKEARIFHMDSTALAAQVVRAPEHHVHRHPKSETGAGAEHNHPSDAHAFFKSIAQALEGAERVLVVGPGTAKLQFIHYAYKQDPKLEPRIVAVETVDHPSNGQLIAYAKEHFAADDRMQGTRP